MRPLRRVAAALLALALAGAAAAEAPAPEAADPGGSGGSAASDGSPVPAASGSLSLEALMERWARTSGVRARFREVREVSLLAEPVETRGELAFVPPDRFARHTTSPGRTSLVVRDDRIVLRDELGGETLDVAADPVAREFVESFLVLWGGDLEALRERYTTEFEAGAEGQGWLLRLVPKSRRLRGFVASLALHGEGPRLARMVLVEADGDRTTTFFESLETDVEFRPEELEALFPPAAP